MATSFELSNGIPVILQDYEGPVAATYWWNNVGSADEAPAEAGFAHFLEHMLFKDAAAKETGKASSGQLARAVESLGGDINAYTSFEQTVYHVTCAEQHWERILDAFGAMAKPQKFLNQDFKREREVILEELRKNEDTPGRQLFQALFTATFPKHPYGRPVIGFTKTLNAAKVGALEAFYKRNYVSERMGIILVGPIGPEGSPRRKKLVSLLEKRFGRSAIPRRAGARPARPHQVESQADAVFKVQPFDVKTPSLAITFRTPALSHPDMPALDLAASILGSGELGRLYQRLFYKDSIATEASAGLYVPKDAGMFYAQAELTTASQVDPAARAILSELKRLATDGPTAEELARVLVAAESERLYATQSADGMAGRLAFLKFVLGDLQYDQAYLQQLRAVTAQRIQEVCRTYLSFDRMSLVAMVPKTDKDLDLAPLKAHAKSFLGSAVPAPAAAKKRASPTLRDPLEIWSLPSGARVAHYHRPQSHAFSLHASVLGGLRLELAEGASDWGASNLMALTWDKGTATKDSQRIASEVEGRAAGIDGFSGRNSVGLQLTGLARDFEPLSALVGELLLEPTFPEAELEHSKRVVEDSIRGVEDHTSQLCSKLFLETLFEKHPYGRMPQGSLETVRGLTAAKLRSLHKRWLRPDRLAIAVSGAVPPEKVRAWAEELDRALIRFAGAGKAAAQEPQLAAEHRLTAPRWVERSLGREQTHLLVGGLGSTLDADDRHALRLLQNVLGGQSGTLFIELREKKSLAYTVAPVSFEGLEPGYVGTYIACAPNKKDEALQGIRKVLETVARKGVSRSELERAKEYFLGKRAMDLQGDVSMASHFGLELLYRLPRVTEGELAAKIRKLQSKDLQQVCRKYLLEPHLVTSSVG